MNSKNTPTKQHYLTRASRAFSDPESDDPIAKYAVQVLAAEIAVSNEVDDLTIIFGEQIRHLTYGQLDLAFRNSEIAVANDLFRRFGPIPQTGIEGRIVCTHSVARDPNKGEIVDAVRGFDSFKIEDDPYDQHDFAAITVLGTKYYFKIDYYDPSVTFGVDPLKENPYRVMTIMRADEY